MKIDSIIKLSLVFIPVIFVILGIASKDKDLSAMLVGGGLGSFGTLIKSEFADKVELNQNKLEVNETRDS